MEIFEEMGGTIRGQAAVGPVQMSRGGDTFRTGWVSGRTYILKAGIFVIMCRIIVDFPKLAFQVLGAVRLEWVLVGLSLGCSTDSVSFLAGLSLSLSSSVSTLGGLQEVLFGEDL
jgi:hypothetical protein